MSKHSTFSSYLVLKEQQCAMCHVGWLNVQVRPSPPIGHFLLFPCDDEGDNLYALGSTLVCLYRAAPLRLQ